MKKLTIKFLALFMITTVAFLSCKKVDQFTPVSENYGRPSPNNPGINSADWRITKFQVNGIIQTKDYSAYLFEFANEGVLKAIIRSKVILGTWGVNLKENPERFQISFLNDHLSILNHSDWQIISRTSTELNLKYTNRKKGEELYLNFQRPVLLIDSGLEVPNPN